MRHGSAIVAFLGGVLLLGGCASSDGGSSGTGMTTVQGNVATAQTAALLRPGKSSRRLWFARLGDFFRPAADVAADAGVGDIVITVEGTGFSATTDAGGTFSLQGDFGGPFVLSFARTEDGLAASLETSIPRGGSLTLTNLQLDGRSGKVSADRRRVEFDGAIVAADCSQGVITVVSRTAPDDGNRYTVHLGSSPVTDDGGRPLGCADLQEGSSIHARGDVRDDLTFDSESVEVQGRQPNGQNGGG